MFSDVCSYKNNFCLRRRACEVRATSLRPRARLSSRLANRDLPSWLKAGPARSNILAIQHSQIQRPGKEAARLLSLVAPPLVLNKLHYPGCQNGRTIIHPGLSSQVHSNTPSFSLYLLILPNKNIELAYFHLLLLSYIFTYTNKT